MQKGLVVAFDDEFWVLDFECWTLNSFFKGAPGMNRTCDLRIRNPSLYPLSYGGWDQI
jgi:hypothetical protein